MNENEDMSVCDSLAPAEDIEIDGTRSGAQVRCWGAGARRPGGRRGDLDAIVTSDGCAGLGCRARSPTDSAVPTLNGDFKLGRNCAISETVDSPLP